MKNSIVAALLAVSLTACFPMKDETARRALESQGLTDIQFHGIALIGCGEKDMFRKKFTATTMHGTAVSGVVCGGVLKGATVRTD